MAAKKAASKKRKKVTASRKKAVAGKVSKRRVGRKEMLKKKLASKKVSKKKVAKKSAKKKPASKKVSKKAARKRPTVKKKAASKKRPAVKKKAASKKRPAVKKKAASKKRPSVTRHAPRRAPKLQFRQRNDLLSGPIHGIRAYKPRRGERYMGTLQLEHFQEILDAWKHELIAEVGRTVHHMQDEAANFPDPNDRATQESAFGLELRTRDRERKLLRKIDSALARIDEGSYGYCDQTGEEIGLQRLEARPVATLSLEAQERRELAERQFRDRDDRYR